MVLLFVEMFDMGLILEVRYEFGSFLNVLFLIVRVKVMLLMGLFVGVVVLLFILMCYLVVSMLLFFMVVVEFLVYCEVI